MKSTSGDAAVPGPSPPESQIETDSHSEHHPSSLGHVEGVWDSDSSDESAVESRSAHAWRTTSREPSHPKTGVERVLKAMDNCLKRGHIQYHWNRWRLHATRKKAQSLAVWAIDQGNRKAYELEVALGAENSWASRSIIWEGYTQNPLAGLTDSGWFWAASKEEASREQMAAALKVAHTHVSTLKVQVEAARQQLIEWQEVADFHISEDGTWQSSRLQALQRQVMQLKKQARSAPRLNVNIAADLSACDEISEEEEGSVPASPVSAGPRLASDVRNWMLGYGDDETHIEIISTIPGLGTPSAAHRDMWYEQGEAGIGLDVGPGAAGHEEGSKAARAIDGRMRHAARDMQAQGHEWQDRATILEDILSNKDDDEEEQMNGEDCSKRGLVDMPAVQSTKYEELRAFSHMLEKKLLVTLAKLDIAMEGENKARMELQELRSAVAMGNLGNLTVAEDLTEAKPSVVHTSGCAFIMTNHMAPTSAFVVDTCAGSSESSRESPRLDGFSEHSGPTDGLPADSAERVRLLQEQVAELQDKLREKTSRLEEAITHTVGMEGLEYVL